MVRKTTLALGAGAAAAALAGVAAWSVRASRDAERVPYTVVEAFDGVEIRRYPTAVVAETTAASEREAFGRLFRYISGANATDEAVAMTAPVETGERIEMTAPVETDEREGGVRMGFYLPPGYDYETAPEPTESAVRLVELPERTLAVRRFSWWATGGRVERQTAALREALDDRADLLVVGEPFLYRYDAPWTPPFLRRNEAAVEVRRVANAS